jgi:ATP-dependent helicase/nuclease subunit A
MDQLILLGTMKDIDRGLEGYAVRGIDFSGARSYLDFLIPALEHTDIVLCRSDRRDLRLRRVETEQRKEDIRRLILGKAGCGERPGPDEGRSGPDGEIRRRLGYEYGHREALGLKSKFTVSELSRLASDRAQGPAAGARDLTAALLPAPKFTRAKSSFTGAERGTILHKVMERLDFGQMASGRREETARAVVADMVERSLLTQEEAGTVSYPRILGFFDSEIGRRACRAERLWKEASFNLMKEMAGESVIIQGTIDCYFEEAGKYVLLDYKSGYLANPEDEAEIGRLTEHYRVQLELYREALEKIRGVRAAEAWLYLFSAGRAVRIGE